MLICNTIKLPIFFRINKVFLNKEIFILLYENYCSKNNVDNYKKIRRNIRRNNSSLS